LNDLRFTYEEFEDVINGFNIQYPKLPLHQAAKNRLWKSTLVRLALEAIRDRYWDSVLLCNVEWKDSLAVKFIISSQLIAQISNSRAVHKFDNFREEERKLLDRLLLTSKPLKEYEAMNYTSETRESLILKGLICYETEDKLAITAPIIEQLLIHCLHGSHQPLEINILQDFVLETLKRISPDALQNSLSYNKKKEGASIYERQWQMEFYRAARSVLQPKYYLSPDYGDETSDGAPLIFLSKI